jgi:hypothetical protein
MSALRNAIQKASANHLQHLQTEDVMKPSKIMLKLAHITKPESAVRMRRRIKQSIREYNQQGIRSNWIYQSQR